MLIQTAQAAAHIQYPAPICTPFFAEKRGIEPLQPPYIVWLSDFKPESQLQTPSFVSPRWMASPGVYAPDELIEFDILPGEPPVRPGGKIVAALKYVGRGTPIQLIDVWE